MNSCIVVDYELQKSSENACPKIIVSINPFDSIRLNNNFGFSASYCLTYESFQNHCTILSIKFRPLKVALLIVKILKLATHWLHSWSKQQPNIPFLEKDAYITS